MFHINLLPWRAAKHEREKKDILLHFAFVALLAVFTIVMWHMYLKHYNHVQNQRIAHLTEKLQQFNKEAAVYQPYKTQSSELSNTIGTITQLHENRYQTAYLFNNLSSLIPKSARLNLLKYDSEKLTLSGEAHSNQSIAQLMQNLEASKWLTKLDLDETKRNKRGKVSFRIYANINASQLSATKKWSPNGYKS